MSGWLVERLEKEHRQTNRVMKSIQGGGEMSHIFRSLIKSVACFVICIRLKSQRIAAARCHSKILKSTIPIKRYI